MQTVVETPSYLKTAERLFREEEREEVVATVSLNPERGNLLAGTGGFRKLRVGRDGIGKRGRARVVYIFPNERFPVFLVAAYGKNAKENLTNAERNDLAKIADAIFSRYGG